MSCTSSNKYLNELYDYARESGVSEIQFLSKDNISEFIKTSVDAYTNYPLFCNIFKGPVNRKTLSRMMLVDYKSRLHMDMIGGLTSSEKYEAVIMFEPPMTGKIGIREYMKVAKPLDYLMLLNPSFYRQEAYEDYSLEKRKPYLDDKTWYVYVFATKKECQRKGFGKPLINLLTSFAKEKGYRICLETDLKENVAMYEKFGFKLKDESVYKGNLNHYVLLYGE
ncbi:MAG: GNAT family N-acetyltransferase [Lachnospiraceae bacterium]|nr:GNAT family N-acetyltransferase [Lachnospiraceae bacterium]